MSGLIVDVSEVWGGLSFSLIFISQPWDPVCNVQIDHPGVIVRPSLVLSTVKLPPSLPFMKCSPFAGNVEKCKCLRVSEAVVVCGETIVPCSGWPWLLFTVAETRVDSYRRAQERTHSHTSRAANVLPLSLALSFSPLSVLYTHIIWQRARWC